MIRVVLIDDHVALTDAMTMLLSRESGIDVIASLNEFDNGLHSIQNNEMDVVVIDMNLGNHDSCDLIAAANQKNIIPIVLSAYTELAMIKRAMRSGARGYIAKAAASKYLIEGIRAVYNNRTYYDPIVQQEINGLINLRGNVQSTTTKEKASLIQLTPREKDIIRLIALEYTSDEIAKELFLSKNTIDSYRKKLIQKLQVKNAVGLGLYAFKNNLI